MPNRKIFLITQVQNDPQQFVPLSWGGSRRAHTSYTWKARWSPRTTPEEEQQKEINAWVSEQCKDTLPSVHADCYSIHLLKGQTFTQVKSQISPAHPRGATGTFKVKDGTWKSELFFHKFHFIFWNSEIPTGWYCPPGHSGTGLSPSLTGILGVAVKNTVISHQTTADSCSSDISLMWESTYCWYIPWLSPVGPRSAGLRYRGGTEVMLALSIATFSQLTLQIRPETAK